VGHYPVLTYLSPFTTDEIQEGKRCLLNNWRRPPDAPRSPMRFKDSENKEFQLNVLSLETPQKGASQVNATQEENKEEEKEVQIQEPKTRAAGGVWLLSSDFPHCFQHFIIYHNPNKLKHKMFH